MSCFSWSRAWRIMDFLPPAAEYGKARQDPRQGWWVTGKNARFERPLSTNTIRSAADSTPIGGRWMDRVSASDPYSAEPLARQSRQRRPPRRLAVDNAT